MISWIDDGIILSTQEHGEKYTTITIFTKEHGKVIGLTRTTKSQTLLNFSLVQVSYNSRADNSNGFWKLLSEKPTWISIYNSENHLIVCQGICFILNKMLPFNAKYSYLYELTEYVLSHLKQFNKEQILFLYAYFELTMLKNLGFSLSLNYTDIFLNFDDILDIVSSQQFQLDIHQLLCISSRIMEQHLTKVDNFFRASIINKTTSYIKDQEEI